MAESIKKRKNDEGKTEGEMAEVIEVSDTMLLASLRNLYDMGDISLEQYAGCLRRYRDNIDRQFRKNLWYYSQFREFYRSMK